MKKKLCKLVTLFTAICILFSGCALIDICNYLFFGYYPDTPFPQMEYIRPDVTAVETAAQECAELAKTEEDIEVLVEKIGEFTQLFTDFSTQYSLAYIHYCQNMSDSYWEGEYTYCEERTAQAEAARDQLMHELAVCPLRDELAAEEYFGEGWYEDYLGDSLWTETFQALMEQEAQLEAKYYELTSSAAETGYSQDFFESPGKELETLYIELVSVRQQIAQEAGYESYPAFAYEYYYNRDYTDRQAIAYCNDIRQELVPLYRDLAQSGFWAQDYSGSTEKATFEYVDQLSQQLGGVVREAFEHMAGNQLYDISIDENKHSGSFELYLYSYMQPYVFVGSTGTVLDKLSFTHEFGHYCNDYVSQGSIAGIDVAEVFSQGLEYLSLCYTRDNQELGRLQMGNSLSTYVEQAAYACFEQQVYGLAQEDLTVENIRALFERTGNAFGFDSWGFDSRTYVLISHFYTQPLYVISYVVSNDAALQIYQKEREQAGAGLKIYTDTLATEAEGLMEYLEEAGLVSPFAEGRIGQVKETFQQALE